MAKLYFDNVSIHYPIFNSRTMSIRNQLVRIATGGIIEREEGGVQIVSALNNVSFQINDGDAVGLVGHNGAGKSTLLRTMAGVYAPATGHVTREGRVATLFDMGAGMDPELSGRENIWRMGFLLGMSRTQINDEMSAIEDFTQLGDFLELPMRTYSTGMAMRLMFAVATSTAPEILLVDEVFGTGDFEFQKKAKVRMQTLLQSVKILVFASHAMTLVREHCNRFFLLEHGVVREIDESELSQFE
jgi:ABC-type polysaccharide/polyol phosphate transport system ATPase subunit